MTTTTMATPRPVLRFTTTLVVAVPYVLVFLPMAIWNDNPGTDFILRTAGLALLGTFLVEGSVALVAAAERRSGRSPVILDGQTGRWDARRVTVVAKTVTVTAMVSNLALVLLGGLTLVAQVNSVVPSGVVTVLSPFLSWSYLALALLVAAGQLGGMTKASTLRWILVLVGSQVAMAFVTSITARAATFTIIALTLALITRLVPTRWIIATAALGIATWPTVYAIRNDRRTSVGVDVSEDQTAGDRLRFDEQITRGEQYGPGHDLGQPDLWESLRYGLVPRFLDPERPALSSGNSVNEFMGGSSTSAYTFLPVATTWFFWGAVATVLLYALFALAMVSLRPWRSIGRRPIALVLMTYLVSGPLAWFATPPDATAGMIQAIVAASPVLLVLVVWARSVAEDGSPTRDTVLVAPSGAPRRQSTGQSR